MLLFKVQKFFYKSKRFCNFFVVLITPLAVVIILSSLQIMKIICMIFISILILINGEEFDLSGLSDGYMFKPDILNINEECKHKYCHTLPRKRNNDINDGESVSSILSHQSLQWVCPCETEYELINLGFGNYPQYIASAKCVSKACNGKFNRCKLINYRIHILRQREVVINEKESEEKQFLEQFNLPESLRFQWEFKPLKIAVACVADNPRK